MTNRELSPIAQAIKDYLAALHLQAGYIEPIGGEVIVDCVINVEEMAREIETSVASPTQAAADVIAERRRQVEVEGWTAERDDAEHSCGQLASAAACYAWFVGEGPLLRQYYADFPRLPPNWPWNPVWWKPSTPRRDLVKAGALILAEIERLDRAAERDAK